MRRIKKLLERLRLPLPAFAWFSGSRACQRATLGRLSVLPSARALVFVRSAITADASSPPRARPFGSVDVPRPSPSVSQSIRRFPWCVATGSPAASL